MTLPSSSSRLLKNAHLRRFPHSSPLQRTCKYASLLRVSGAWHLGVFKQPAEYYECRIRHACEITHPLLRKEE